MKHSYIVRDIVVILFCSFILARAGIVSKSRVVLCNQEKDVETNLDDDVEPTVQEEPCKKKLVIAMTLRNAQVAIAAFFSY